MDLGNVLRKSFMMLKERPKMFLPKIVSTGISTAWILSFPGIYSGSVSEIGLSTLKYYLLSMPFIVFLGVFVSVMLAEMVSGKALLRKSFFKTVSRWKTLSMVTLGMIISIALAYVPTAAGAAVTSLTGSILFLFAGFLVSLMVIVVFSFLVFFLPVSITESGGMGKILKRSVTSSLGNSHEVSLMLFFSLFLIIVAFSVQGALKTLGLIGFAASRMVSAVVTTYLFVVSPNMYFQADED